MPSVHARLHPVPPPELPAVTACLTHTNSMPLRSALLCRHFCRARLERFNLFWQQEGVVLAANSTVEVASGALVYGGVDWVASAISADENAGAMRRCALCRGCLPCLAACLPVPSWLPASLTHLLSCPPTHLPTHHPPTQFHPPTHPPTHAPTHLLPADLRDPAAWSLAPRVGNPASMHSNEMRAMFDTAFRGDVDVSEGGLPAPSLVC